MNFIDITTEMQALLHSVMLNVTTPHVRNKMSDRPDYFVVTKAARHVCESILHRLDFFKLRKRKKAIYRTYTVLSQVTNSQVLYSVQRRFTPFEFPRISPDLSNRLQREVNK